MNLVTINNIFQLKKCTSAYTEKKLQILQYSTKHNSQPRAVHLWV